MAFYHKPDWPFAVYLGDNDPLFSLYQSMVLLSPSSRLTLALNPNSLAARVVSNILLG